MTKPIKKPSDISKPDEGVSLTSENSLLDTPLGGDVTEDLTSTLSSPLRYKIDVESSGEVETTCLAVPHSDKAYLYDPYSDLEFLRKTKLGNLFDYVGDEKFEEFCIAYNKNNEDEQRGLTREKLDNINQLVHIYRLKEALSSYNWGLIDVYPSSYDMPPLVFNEERFDAFLSHSMPGEDINTIKGLHIDKYLGIALKYSLEQFKQTPLFEKLSLLRGCATGLLPPDKLLNPSTGEYDLLRDRSADKPIDMDDEKSVLIHINALHNNGNGHMSDHYLYLEDLPNYLELLHINYAEMLGVPKQFQFDIKKEVSVDGQDIMIIAQGFFDMNFFNMSGYIEHAKYIVCERDGKKVFICDTGMTEHKFIAAKYGYKKEEVLGGGKMDIKKDGTLEIYEQSRYFGKDPYQESGFTKKVFEQIMKK